MLMDVLKQALVVIAEPTVINSNCNMQKMHHVMVLCDGDATAAGAGGTAPYTYSWSVVEELARTK